ncbi:MAG TPA: UDP-2,3-diacylglucosamine diphosphatase [Syntrophales bacterium]|nr:UDP-2,3-diacylglucosamine diphosphatase [Syntrophales bacterium]HPQ44797.1 UDP-2,3-diacylglucosamine diphosphatase [Syntrophales bacterium]
MKAVFIADAHLNGSASDGQRNLMLFLSSLKGDVDEMFIVGDFFDFWFSNRNDVYPGFREAVEKLLEIKYAGTGISFFEGNHDFFLGDYFGQYDIGVFPDGATIDLDGKKIYVSHGDTVDDSDTSYLFWRRVLRSRLFYAIQRKIPSPFLWGVSSMFSRLSRNAGKMRSPNGLAGKMNKFAEEKFQEGFDAVVLGHCHCPTLEQHVLHDRMRTFVILGDWIGRYGYLLYEDGEFMMKSGVYND